ncbi:MAG: hypothetical protein NTV92_00980 [Candidatus Bipolaricaulota bacterium]|nr:hypothetical protein [Candidatus Bipolaricaulota bacterium]
MTAERLRGARVEFSFPSVGATEQLLMTGTLASGVTEIVNAAVEPEVLDLVELLRAMGAEIEVEGRTIRVAEARLHGAEHTLIPDRIEAGTLLLAGVATRGAVTVVDVRPDHLEPFLAVLRAMGVDVVIEGGDVTASAAGGTRGVDIRTAPHPGTCTPRRRPRWRPRREQAGSLRPSSKVAIHTLTGCARWVLKSVRTAAPQRSPASAVGVAPRWRRPTFGPARRWCSAHSRRRGRAQCPGSTRSSAVTTSYPTSCSLWGRTLNEEKREGDRRPLVEDYLGARARVYGTEQAILVGVDLEGHSEDLLGELESLADTAGIPTLATVVQNRFRPDGATFVGKGKTEEVGALADEVGADVVIFNNDLSPGQARNLEEALGRKVIDRTQLILDIFAQRAATKEAKRINPVCAAPR